MKWVVLSTVTEVSWTSARTPAGHPMDTSGHPPDSSDHRLPSVRPLTTVIPGCPGDNSAPSCAGSLHPCGTPFSGVGAQDVFRPRLTHRCHPRACREDPSIGKRDGWLAVACGSGCRSKLASGLAARWVLGPSPRMTRRVRRAPSTQMRVTYPTFSIFFTPPMYGTSASGSVTEPSAS